MYWAVRVLLDKVAKDITIDNNLLHDKGAKVLATKASLPEFHSQNPEKKKITVS